MHDHVFLRLRPSKVDTISPEAQVGILSSFLNLGKRTLLDRLTWKSGLTVSFSIVSIDQKTRFYMSIPREYHGYFSSQVLSQYPRTLIEVDAHDPLAYVRGGRHSAIASLQTSSGYKTPIKTFKDSSDSLPPLSAVLGYLGKINQEDSAMVQYVFRAPYSQSSYESAVRKSMKVTGAEGVERNDEFSSLYQEKLKSPFLECQARLIYAAKDEYVAKAKLAELAGTFGIFSRPESNTVSFKNISDKQKNTMLTKIHARDFHFWQPMLVLNLQEAASLWHLPDNSFEQTKNLDWGKTIAFEAPDNLPVIENYPEAEQKREVNFFAKTEWRNHETIFGLEKEDRRRHVYVIGKTGAGKSTLIANMAINDIRNGEGVAVIDPHGDLSEMILDYIPKRRINDVVYLDPTLSDDRSFSLNLFDADGAANTDIVASGIVSIFQKMFHYSWGPRLEYILRNTILSLLYHGNATFADIPRMLTQQKFRKKVVEKLRDKDLILTSFWEDEFEKMNDKLKTDAIAPVLNKVGQFLSAQTMRRIVGTTSSSISFQEIMDEGKILIINLSQGKLGEDSTALLGAMVITKIQLTAMRRVYLEEDQRRDFNLYVDEFQNFATSSFVKILSEARKYRLNLMMANQYIDQVDEHIQKAVFGNVGTLATFVVSAGDAAIFEKEFGGQFTVDDLVALGKYEILLKMTIKGLTSTPFMAKTLPPPAIMNQNAEKIMRLSTEKYYRKVR